MNTNYFRITGYYPQENFSFIIDCNGMFEKKWQFSSMLIQKGIKVLEVNDAEQFLDGNITKVNPDLDHIILRATCEGKPEYIDQTINGITYKAVKVGVKCYVPNKENR